MVQKTFRLLMVSLVALVCLGAVAVALGQSAPAQAAPVSAPAAVLKNVKQVVLYSGNGITESKTGSAYSTIGYASADCYAIVDVTSLQTVTAIISHSADAQNWVTWNTYSAVSADGTAFTTSVPYGAYFRASVTLGTANAVTPTVRCVLKD